MTEVLRDNFETLFPKIEKDLKQAAVISIDTEFSGLLSSDDFKSSLFDSAQERYLKQRENISDVLLLQFGLTAFTFDRERNSYSSHSYSFYLFPRTFGSIDVRFKCQASSFEFLCHHKFDFNKFVYNGISFLNEEQDLKVQQELQEGHLFRSVERALSFEDEDSVQALCSQVAIWLAGGQPAEEATAKSMVLDVPKSSQTSQCIAYVVHHELRRRFISVWTIPENGNVRVLKVSATERAMLESSDTHEAELKTALLQSLRGFSRVFKLLVDMKKPIIAHNCTLDLMIMFKQFCRPLPSSYQSFKDSIHSLFPIVYDTKYMSSEFKRKVSKFDCWTSNTLEPLYKYFAMGKGFTMVPCSPIIDSHDYTLGCDPRFHDAAWDSYCAGVCFIRMAHFFSALDLGRLSLAKPFTSTELVALTDFLANHINIIRGNLTHFVLGGPDPPSHRPEVIVVKKRDGGRLDLVQLTERFSKHGSVDVKLTSEKIALVAASSKGMVMDICRDFYKDSDYIVVKYNKIHHNPVIRTASWCTLALSFALSGFFLYRAFSRAR
ncbi:pre-piRNA 3'-exonuclease trimmer-like [Thrips palmi]|uniref:Pre-piRNA 3'-exonuclease trimmer-like n=1 Tax=Thrips palmi TaxID=161013 RepID=A0A6P9A472_THRPL|nr:pre-piRNA 3'-exonuclease trimmer-like [Thrips palmi]